MRKQSLPFPGAAARSHRPDAPDPLDFARTMKAFSQSTLGHRAGIAAHVLRVGFPPLIIAMIARRRPLVRQAGKRAGVHHQRARSSQKTARPRAASGGLTASPALCSAPDIAFPTMMQLVCQPGTQPSRGPASARWVPGLLGRRAMYHRRRAATPDPCRVDAAVQTGLVPAPSRRHLEGCLVRRAVLTAR